MNDRYVLEGKLGSDGDVYAAYDRYLDQTVAFKLLHPDGGVPQSWEEARRLEQLKSRFVVPVINADIVLNSDLRFVVTRLLPDGDLESEARPHGLSTGLAVRLGIHLASGIAAVHAARMVHRDIKPANALLDGDIALVSDFEFCMLVDQNEQAPRSGSWCTLAPEVADFDGLCTVASDVYSLSATIFYLLSGEYPVDHRIPREDQQRLIARGDLRSLGDLAPHVPRTVVSVVKKGMSVDPSRRYGTAAELANALATAASRRRSWRRIEHPGHLYCAQSEPGADRKELGVCSVLRASGCVMVRAFHVHSGQAVAHSSKSDVHPKRLVTALRGLFEKLN